MAPLEAMALTETESPIECLVLHRYLGTVQLWHAQGKVTVPLFGGQSKKTRFILTCNPILQEKNTSELAEI